MYARLTLQDFLALPDDDTALELIDGRAVPKMSPKFFHSTVQAALWLLIRDHCRGRGRVRQKWGVILVRRGRDWVPVPDLTYVSYERLPRDWQRNELCPVAAEWVIEVVSPQQSIKILERKAEDYLEAGVLSAWIVNPEAETVTVYSGTTQACTYAGDTLIPAPIPMELSVRQIFLEAQSLDT